MGSLQEAGHTPVRVPQDAISFYQGACVPRASRRIGCEWERHTVYTDTGYPVPYLPTGDRPGIEDLLRQTARRFGWTLVYEDQNPHPLALKRVTPGGRPGVVADLEQITFEPMGALEISSPACLTLKELDERVHTINAEVLQVCDDLGFSLLGAGYHPCSGFTPALSMPKRRYELMARCVSAESLKTATLTCSAQYSFNYTSERDFRDQTRLLLQLAPVVMALGNNSPLAGCRMCGIESVRMQGWNDYARERGLRTGMCFDPGFGFEAHATAMFATPMMFRVEDGHYVPTEGATFGSFAAQGRATLTDYANQLSTQSPIVRNKAVLELGVQDSPRDPEKLMGTMAFLTGLLYDSVARYETSGILRDWDEATCNRLRDQAPETGLRTPVGGGRTLRDVACELVTVSTHALRHMGEDPDLLLPLHTPIREGSLAHTARRLFTHHAEPLTNRQMVDFYATPRPTPREERVARPPSLVMPG